MDTIILLFCSFISCVIIISIFFQFWNDRYSKVYSNKYLYTALFFGNIFIVMLANMRMSTLLNTVTNALLVGLISYFFYCEENAKKMIRIFESEALFVVIGVSEALGAYLIDLLLTVANVVPESAVMLLGIETAFSKIVVLFLYYAVFSRLWKKSVLRTKTHYILYLVMFVYSIVNVLATSVISNRENLVVLMVIISCTVFANMYMLYFIRFIHSVLPFAFKI